MVYSTYLIMVIWGIGYDCFNHIAVLYQLVRNQSRNQAFLQLMKHWVRHDRTRGCIYSSGVLPLTKWDDWSSPMKEHVFLISDRSSRTFFRGGVETCRFELKNPEPYLSHLFYGSLTYSSIPCPFLRVSVVPSSGVSICLHLLILYNSI